MEHKLRIDWILCDGYSLCGDAAPDVIDLDEWGYPIIASGPIHPEHVRDVKRAVAQCPMKALKLVAADADRRK